MDGHGNSIALTGDGLAQIEDGRGITLRVQTGSVWLTQAGSFRDVLLKAGESFCIESNGTTLLSTFNGARFALVALER
jgi:hypothetical protein